MNQSPLLRDEDLTLLRNVRHHASEIAECASLLYWETQYPDTVRRRLDTSLSALTALLAPAQASFAPKSRTRYSWDGKTVTAHEETV